MPRQEMDEFYHEWRIHIDDREGGGVMVFAPQSKYGTPIIAEDADEGLERAIAYIDRQIAPGVSPVRASAEDEARNFGLDFSQGRKKVEV